MTESVAPTAFSHRQRSLFYSGESIMKLIARIIAWLVAVIIVVAIGAASWLYVFPPELIRVADAYSAKIVCSSVFVSGRTMDEAFKVDVQAPGNPMLKYIKVEQVGADRIDASFKGVLARESAVYRPGLGCASVPTHDIDAVRAIKLAKPYTPPAPSDFEWPLGDTVSRDPDPRVQALIADPKLSGPGMRAIVVVKDGRLAADAYAPGFTADTPLLGWSMTKTVIGALISARIQDGDLQWEQDHLFAEWTDDRAAITIANLMAMQSGLKLQESYGDVNDVTRMLFLEADQAAFVRDKPLEAKPGSTFNYTTGTGVALARILMNTFSDPQAALTYPRTALFDPIGMHSAVLETDAVGTFSGGSLMYANARDWARFGLLLANGGDWNGEQVLPAEFAVKAGAATAVSGGRYSEALTWKSGTGENNPEPSTLPADAFWLLGHDGQSIAVVPSEKLVVVRMGLTPSTLGYDPTPLVKAIMEAAREPLPEPEPELPQ
jgi:CubicO group peptidase (beta-lactamase class C family)